MTLMTTPEDTDREVGEELDTEDLVEQIAKMGRMRPASVADLRHALQQARHGVPVRLELILRRDAPWEATYERACRF